MTTDELTKKLIQDCEQSELPMADQAAALGTAYATYLIANGVPPAELRYFLDRAIKIIEDIKNPEVVN